MVDQPEIAIRLFAAVDRIRKEIGNKMGLADQKEYGDCLQLAKNQMDGAAFSESWRDGQAMSMDQAVKEALSDLEI